MASEYIGATGLIDDAGEWRFPSADMRAAYEQCRDDPNCNETLNFSAYLVPPIVPAISATPKEALDKVSEKLGARRANALHTEKEVLSQDGKATSAPDGA